ncbi:MAG TPA: hypothetical protein DCX54_09225 [Flavobacteriales bacterium]|nr:hypothetical protein [Flavobacteriales bacterium]
MKKILLFSVALISSVVLLAQNCQPVMPDAATSPYVVYDANANHVNSGDVVWVCKDLTVEISGDGNTVFIEKGCTITLSGDGNTLYMKGTGNLTISGNTNNPVTFEASVTYNDNGTGNTLGSCDTLKYDYTDAPKAPKKFCNVWLGLNEVKTHKTLSLYPNPAINVLNYQISSDVNTATIEIFSASGQKVYADNIAKKEGEIDISGLNKGLYLVRINSDKGQYTGRVNVE